MDVLELVGFVAGGFAGGVLAYQAGLRDGRRSGARDYRDLITGDLTRAAMVDPELQRGLRRWGTGALDRGIEQVDARIAEALRHNDRTRKSGPDG